MKFTKLGQLYQILNKISTELEYILSDCKQAKENGGVAGTDIEAFGNTKRDIKEGKSIETLLLRKGTYFSAREWNPPQR